MEFYAVYVISSDGRPMLTEIYKRNLSIPNNVISAGLLKALEDFDISFETLDTTSLIEDCIEIDGLNYSIKKFGDFSVVLVDKILDDRKNIMNKIGIKFLRQFGESDLLNWKGNAERFDEFKTTIHGIMKQKSTGAELAPQELKKITTADIFELDQMVQPVALAMLVLEKATIEEIAAEINASNEMAEQYLHQLKNKGYLGTISEDGDTIYHTISE